MPRAAKTPKPDPNAIYRSWQGFAVDVDGVPVSVGVGERLRGDHPAVRAAFWNFVEDGWPLSEAPSAW
jgi:hypothetical protein